MAGSLVVGLAEALSAVCVVQAACPGAPVFICFIPSMMDLKTGDFTGGAPEDTVMGAAVGDVGHFYGLPTQCGVNASGAKSPGWQSALDDVTTTCLSLAAGVDLLTGVGMVSGGRIFSYEEMALGAEAATQVRTVAHGIDLSGLSDAAPWPGVASGAHAPGGAPLPTAGPSLIDDQPHRYWAAGGRQTALDRAHERVVRILAEHRPTALDAAVDAELRRLAQVERPPRA
jgi:trimethylamine--corrinoid protein Co-methyltransferase